MMYECPICSRGPESGEMLYATVVPFPGGSESKNFWAHKACLFPEPAPAPEPAELILPAGRDDAARALLHMTQDAMSKIIDRIGTLENLVGGRGAKGAWGAIEKIEKRLNAVERNSLKSLWETLAVWPSTGG